MRRWWRSAIIGLWLPGLVLAALCASAGSPARPLEAGTTAPLLSIKFGPSEIWKPSQSAVSALHQCQHQSISCVQPIMQQDGASADAIAFFQLTGWFLNEIQNSGVVQLATILNPWAANENLQPALLGGVPAIVYPAEQDFGPLAEHESGYADLQAAHPNITFWDPGPRPEPMTQSADGGQEFVFDYRLLDGCHACAILGYARFAFDFGPDGTFEGPRFLNITPNTGG
jgi:hypothetical protein